MTTPELGPSDKRVHVVFRADEHSMLLELVRTSGLSMTDVLRQLVRQAHHEAKAFNVAPVLPPGPKKARR